MSLFAQISSPNGPQLDAPPDRAIIGGMRKKSDLPTKTCPVCDRPFTWRKKWAKHWDEVVYCSERCRRSRGRAKQTGQGAS